MMKSISFIILLIGLYTSVVYGETVEMSGTPNQIFRVLSGKHVEILLDRGISKIGKLNLKKLSKELNTVEWRTFEIGFLLGSGGNRLTSVYVVEDRMVIINSLSFENLIGKPVHLYSWALHEGLGALGYNDENYELSASISFLAENSQLANHSSNITIKDHFQKIDRSKVGLTYASSGGSTVVGGGGDAIIIELKQLLLKRYFEWIKINHSELSNEKIKQGFNSLIKFKMETYQKGNIDFNNISFWLEEKTLYLSAGSQFNPAPMYKVENLDRILDTLQEYL